MRRLHLDILKPVCPVCRRGNLTLEPGAETTSNAVVSGILRCRDAACGQRFPIIAGVPVLVPDLTGWLSANLHHVLASNIENAAVEAVVGAAVGPESAFNLARQQQSRYAHDHYGDLFDRETSATGQPPGSVRRGQEQVLQRFGPGRGPGLDLGCAAGRTTFDLAAGCDQPVLGVDVNWPLLRIGRGILDHGLLRYPLRRLGNRYERRETYLFPPEADAVDFWIADAQSLPFADDTFQRILALNVLDCVPDPARLVAEVSRILQPAGDVAFATPLDWAPHATPASAWLESQEALEAMVAWASRDTPGAKPLRPTGPTVDLPWSVRLHDNATITYRSRLVTMTTAEGERVAAVRNADRMTVVP